MSARNRARREANREARAAAEVWASRRARQRRWAVALAGLGIAAIVAVAFALSAGDDDDPTVDASAGSTPDAAGDQPVSAPCVRVSDPIPEGAPDVPVRVGPAPTELVIEDLKPGTGAELKAGDTVTIHYIGVACSSGRIFDVSFGAPEPAHAALDSFIAGWQDGLPGMKVGGQRLLGIPSDLAYGPNGIPTNTPNEVPLIGPNEALWFVVELLDTQPAGATTTIELPISSPTTVGASAEPTTTVAP
ncbi:MAG: FKBP-type peptidyl-prolyl cis-trans isomerase [Actinomycetota bacterium]